VPGAAVGHVTGSDSPPTLGAAFTLDPWLLVPLILALAAYLAGVGRLWARSRPGAGIGFGQAAAFLAGWTVLLLSLAWPLDAYGEWSLAAHMAQHMLLVSVAPPLIVAGLPAAAFAAGLPTSGARRGAQLLRARGVRRMWHGLTEPMTAMLLQLIVMWGWHAPAAMELALRSEPWHYLMHASFLLVGLFFWSGLLRALREPAAGFFTGIVAVVGTMVQMGLLGALLTFAAVPRYPFYLERVIELGLTPLEDQQLAGLIMWVPGAVPYLLGGLALMAVWLRRLERTG